MSNPESPLRLSIIVWVFECNAMKWNETKRNKQRSNDIVNCFFINRSDHASIQTFGDIDSKSSSSPSSINSSSKHSFNNNNNKSIIRGNRKWCFNETKHGDDAIGFILSHTHKHWNISKIAIKLMTNICWMDLSKKKRTLFFKYFVQSHRQFV